PAWNTWWLWTPRLTTVTVAWLTYVAYFMLRGAIDDGQRRARFAAIYAIVAFATIIMAYFSIRILRDIHPVMFGEALESAQGLEEGLQDFQGLAAAQMGITLTVACVAFTILYIAWVANRLRLQKIDDETAALKARVIAHLKG
ncbi:MAG: cytochrome c biogenesis protein CcsA, partial [Anaerolineales bacterium]|nr:cytochrome c biogenesis protein CcsA [Anaerolineales bacterium]